MKSKNLFWRVNNFKNKEQQTQLCSFRGDGFYLESLIQFVAGEIPFSPFRLDQTGAKGGGGGGQKFKNKETKTQLSCFWDLDLLYRCLTLFDLLGCQPPPYSPPISHIHISIKKSKMKSFHKKSGLFFF